LHVYWIFFLIGDILASNGIPNGLMSRVTCSTSQSLTNRTTDLCALFNDNYSDIHNRNCYHKKKPKISKILLQTDKIKKTIVIFSSRQEIKGKLKLPQYTYYSHLKGPLKIEQLFLIGILYVYSVSYLRL
jgi:hypothetical protein